MSAASLGPPRRAGHPVNDYSARPDHEFAAMLTRAATTEAAPESWERRLVSGLCQSRGCRVCKGCAHECHADPSPAAASGPQDGREEVADWLRARFPLTRDEAEQEAGDLLAVPAVAQALADRDRLRQAIEELLDVLDGITVGRKPHALEQAMDNAAAQEFDYTQGEIA